MTKYPIILIHGIAATDKNSLIDFWGRIPKVFEESGVEYYFGNTDAWNSYKINAEKLKDKIDEVLSKHEGNKVNLIAHSKGGIDARYLIHHYRYHEKIASLTTINTPHHGAELADLFLKPRISHSLATKKIMEVLAKLFLDEKPDPYSSILELTTNEMKAFNEEIKSPETVYVQSYYSTMTSGSEDLFLAPTFKYLTKQFGLNDGIITEHSAKWGQNVVKIEAKNRGLSHSEIVDIKKKDIPDFSVPNFYLSIIEKLKEIGY